MAQVLCPMTCAFCRNVYREGPFRNGPLRQPPVLHPSPATGIRCLLPSPCIRLVSFPYHRHQMTEPRTPPLTSPATYLHSPPPTRPHRATRNTDRPDLGSRFCDDEVEDLKLLSASEISHLTESQAKGKVCRVVDIQAPG